MKTPAAIVLLALLACGCQKAPADFSRTVQVNKTITSNGDSIVIQEVRGPSAQWTVGGTYEVVGRYTLVSHDKATLGAFVTTPSSSATDIDPAQVTEVGKGDGQFKLRFRVGRRFDDCPIGAICGPHISFYPAPGGDAFLSAPI
jgi:hypothetical protein